MSVDFRLLDRGVPDDMEVAVNGMAKGLLGLRERDGEGRS
jgi:hypothetical protein